MKRIAAITFAIGISLPFEAHAWFFFFIPGSITSKISDSVTGAEGDHCVGQQVKVGDPIRVQGGDIMTVKSLSGTSARCTDPNLPIRALLQPRTISSTPVVAVSPVAMVAKTEARLDLPASWERQPMSARLIEGRNVLYSVDKTTNSGLLMATVSRSTFNDVATYATTRSVYVASLLEDPILSPVVPMTINGAKAWRVEILGKSTARLPIANQIGQSITVLQTVYEGSQEIVILNSWTAAANYESQKAELQQIANSLTGIAPASEANSAVANQSVAPDGHKTIDNASGGSQSAAAAKLSQLKSLFEQGLITKDDYDTKKQEILKAM